MHAMEKLFQIMATLYLHNPFRKCILNVTDAILNKERRSNQGNCSEMDKCMRSLRGEGSYIAKFLNAVLEKDSLPSLEKTL